MIIAQITENKKEIQVKVEDVFQGIGGRKVASVRTLDGSQPFSSWTHGGWSSSDSCTVPVQFLSNIQPK